nr:hypothetical protein [Nakamurella lactea]
MLTTHPSNSGGDRGQFVADDRLQISQRATLGSGCDALGGFHSPATGGSLDHHPGVICGRCRNRRSVDRFVQPGSQSDPRLAGLEPGMPGDVPNHGQCIDRQPLGAHLADHADDEPTAGLGEVGVSDQLEHQVLDLSRGEHDGADNRSFGGT